MNPAPVAPATADGMITCHGAKPQTRAPKRTGFCRCQIAVKSLSNTRSV